MSGKQVGHWLSGTVAKRPLVAVSLLASLTALLFWGIKFFGRGADLPPDTSHLPKPAQHAIEDIDAVTAQLGEVSTSPGLTGIDPVTTELKALRRALAAMRTFIAQLPAKTDFTYSPVLQQELSTLLDRAQELQQQRHAATSEELPSQPARLYSLALQRRSERSETLATTSSITPTTEQEAKTSRSPELVALEHEKKQLSEQVRQQRVRQAKQVLEIEFELDRNDIEKLLTAFISPGLSHTTPASKTHLADGQPHPVSLTYLQEYGCLQSTRQSLERLLSAASQVKRPRGHLPRQWGGNMSHLELGMESVQRAEALLIKYADLLVEKNMLSP